MQNIKIFLLWNSIKKNNKFNNLNYAAKKIILKYLDKTIKQLTTIKTIILDDKESLDYKDDKEEIGKLLQYLIFE